MQTAKCKKTAMLCQFNPTPDTVIALIAAIGVVILSLTLLLFNGTSQERPGQIILHDILMALLLGFCFPLYYISLRQRHGLHCLGITPLRLKKSLALNIALTVALSCLFIKITPVLPAMDFGKLCAAIYILVVGVFEVVFFFGFLRFYMEKAFGIIPAIVLTAAFYSLHHAGFQPEFLKLFLIGIMYTAVFYTTRNILVLFPFFWAVWPFWDMLVYSPSGEAIQNVTSLFIAIGLALGMVVFTLFMHRHNHPKPALKKFSTIKHGHI